VKWVIDIYFTKINVLLYKKKNVYTLLKT
jgi:hypothetical protein